MSFEKNLYNNAGSSAEAGKPASKTTNTIHKGRVTEVLEGGRIRVRIKGLDTRVANADLAICSPLIPLYFSFNPKVGETVRIFLSDTSEPYTDRLWVGPVITQNQHLEGQSFPDREVSVSDEGYFKMNELPSLDKSPDATGLFQPSTSQEDQSIVTRGNTDIVFSKNQVSIRAGKHEAGNKRKANTKNPAIVDIHYSEDGNISSINLLADKLNLITHNGDPVFTGTKTPKPTDQQIAEYVDLAHPIAYGDKVAELFKLVITVLCEDHSHPYDGQGAIKSILVKKLLDYNLDELMSQSVKTT